MAKQINYDKAYFNNRDHLDLLIAHSLQIFLKENNLKSLLDVGCGTGKLVEFLKKRGFRAYGCDIAGEAVKIARIINGQNAIKRASAIHLPYKNNAFDIVTAISVIEHLKLKEARIFLNEASRVLKPKGFIFIITPNFRSPFKYLFGKKWFAYSDPTHINFFTSKSITALLTSNGFNNIRFRFRSAYNVSFDPSFPKTLRILPMPFKNFLNYLLITSFLSTFRDSIWVSAQK